MKIVRKADLFPRAKDSIKVVKGTEEFKCTCGGSDFAKGVVPNTYKCINCQKIVIDDGK